jgi:DNA-binding transcriptional LysR family regulator
MTVAVTVQELGSLSAAARRLRMPLPTVSRKVSDLEAHLNARLFNRSTRRLILTDAGETYIAACKRILEGVRETEHTVSGEFSTPRGELVISAPIVFGRIHVLPVIAAFFQAYPEVTVRLSLSDRMVGLLEDHVDLALRIGELEDSRLIATRCGSTRRVVCGSPEYFSQHGTPKHPADLASYAAVIFERSPRPTPGSSPQIGPISPYRCADNSSSIPPRQRLMPRLRESGSLACCRTKLNMRSGWERWLRC